MQLLCLAIVANAAWFTDAAIYTELIAGNNYKVKAIFYVPCEERINVADSISFCIKNPCANNSIQVKAPLKFTTASNGNISLYTSELEVFLNAPCSNWTFSFLSNGNYQDNKNVQSNLLPVYMQAVVNNLDFTGAEQPQPQILQRTFEIESKALSVNYNIGFYPLKGKATDSIYGALIMPRTSLSNCGAVADLSFSQSNLTLNKNPFQTNPNLFFLDHKNATIYFDVDTTLPLGYHCLVMRLNNYRAGKLTGYCEYMRQFKVVEASALNKKLVTTVDPNSYVGATHNGLPFPNDSVFITPGVPFSFQISTIDTTHALMNSFSHNIQGNMGNISRHEILRTVDTLITQFNVATLPSLPAQSILNFELTDTFVDCYNDTNKVFKTYLNLPFYNKAALAISPTLKESIRIYPNPASDKIFINAPQLLDVEMFNSLGQKVWQGKQVKSIDLSQRVNGVYLLKLLHKNTCVRQEKIVVH